MCVCVCVCVCVCMCVPLRFSHASRRAYLSERAPALRTRILVGQFGPRRTHYLCVDCWGVYHLYVYIYYIYIVIYIYTHIRIHSIYIRIPYSVYICPHTLLVRWSLRRIPPVCIYVLHMCIHIYTYIQCIYTYTIQYIYMSAHTTCVFIVEAYTTSMYIYFTYKYTYVYTIYVRTYYLCDNASVYHLYVYMFYIYIYIYKVIHIYTYTIYVYSIYMRIPYSIYICPHTLLVRWSLRRVPPVCIWISHICTHTHIYIQ